MPYVLVVESHDEGPAVEPATEGRTTVVPPVVQNASAVLVTGTLARDSMIARGAAAARVHVFANTIDVEAFGLQVDELTERPDRCGRLGAEVDDVVALSVARLVREKDSRFSFARWTMSNDPRLLLVLAGDGPDRTRLERLVAELGVRAVFAGDTEWEKLVELYVAADVFAPLRARAWAVVVNEAAACGLPLVLSDRVGAARRASRRRRERLLVPAGDVDAAARALRASPPDPAMRRAQGVRSRELVRDWGYGPASKSFPGRCARGRGRVNLLPVSENGRRPRILVLNQYYWPGVEATAHLLTELCEALAEEYDVEVVTGVLHGPRGRSAPGRAQRRPHRARRVDVVRALGTRPEGAELRLVPRLRFRPRALGSAAGSRPRTRPADHRLTSGSSSVGASERPSSSSVGRLSGDRDGLTV